MVESGQLEVVGKAGVGTVAVQVLGELEHVVGVARLRSVDVVDEVGTGLAAGEVLPSAVAAEGQRALAGDDVPEK